MLDLVLQLGPCRSDSVRSKRDRGSCEHDAGATQLSGGQTMENRDVMQVCLNGHVITIFAGRQPASMKPFCRDCGAPTITACPECKAPIHDRDAGSLSTELRVDNNCPQCGTAYPWRQSAIATAIEVVQMDLEGHDAASVAELVNDIAIETPRTAIAALKLKRLLPKLGKATYDVAIKVISDVASETAKKTFGLKP